MKIQPTPFLSPFNEPTRPMTVSNQEKNTAKSEQWTMSKEAERAQSIDSSRIWSLHIKQETSTLTPEEFEEYHFARKTNQALDSALYERDKAKALEEMLDSQTIIMKLLRGEKLSPKEQQMLKENPALRERVQMEKSKQQLINRYQ